MVCQVVLGQRQPGGEGGAVREQVGHVKSRQLTFEPKCPADPVTLQRRSSDGWMNVQWSQSLLRPYFNCTLTTVSSREEGGHSSDCLNRVPFKSKHRHARNIPGEYDFLKRLLRRLIPPLRLRGKLIQMKAGRPSELMRFIITLLLLRLLLMAEVTQMRMKRLHKSISRDTLGPLVPARYSLKRHHKLSRAQSFASLDQFQKQQQIKQKQLVYYY